MRVRTNDLTPREEEVLLLLVKGLSNPQIADAMAVSIHTVKLYVGHIMMKTGIRSRAGLVAYAYDTGYVTTAPAPGDGVEDGE